MYRPAILGRIAESIQHPARCVTAVHQQKKQLRPSIDSWMYRAPGL